jgi:hypothetical protein
MLPASTLIGALEFVRVAVRYHDFWDFQSASFFMFTIVSTIGYGLFTPSTWQGRLFTCCFAVPGMILFGEAMGALLSAPCVVSYCCRICYYSDLCVASAGNYTVTVSLMGLFIRFLFDHRNLIKELRASNDDSSKRLDTEAGVEQATSGNIKDESKGSRSAELMAKLTPDFEHLAWWTSMVVFIASFSALYS